jgi:hypothetical protein
MNDKKIWETPKISPLTDAASRADIADIPSRNGFVVTSV